MRRKDTVNVSWSFPDSFECQIDLYQWNVEVEVFSVAPGSDIEGMFAFLWHHKMAEFFCFRLCTIKSQSTLNTVSFSLYGLCL
jgi:hypothetical protein